jgi:hypothetical protein
VIWVSLADGIADHLLSMMIGFCHKICCILLDRELQVVCRCWSTLTTNQRLVTEITPGIDSQGGSETMKVSQIEICHNTVVEREKDGCVCLSAPTSTSTYRGSTQLCSWLHRYRLTSQFSS